MYIVCIFYCHRVAISNNKVVVHMAAILVVVIHKVDKVMAGVVAVAVVLEDIEEVHRVMGVVIVIAAAVVVEEVVVVMETEVVEGNLFFLVLRNRFICKLYCKVFQGKLGVLQSICKRTK